MSDYFVEGVRAAQEGKKISENPYLLQAHDWDAGFRTTVGMKPKKCKGDGTCKCKCEHDEDYEELEKGIKLGQLKRQILRDNPQILGEIRQTPVNIDDRDTTIVVKSSSEDGKLWPVFAWIAAALAAAIACYFVVQWAVQ